MRALTMDEVGFVSGGTATQPPPRATETVIVTGSGLGGYFSGFSMPGYGVTNISGGGGISINLDLEFDLDEFFERSGSTQTIGQSALVLGALPGNTVSSTTNASNTTTHIVTIANWTITITDVGSNGSLERVILNPGNSTNYIWVPGSGFQPWTGGS